MENILTVSASDAICLEIELEGTLMPVQFSCPHCGQHLEAEDELAGVSCSCPACNKEFVTGAASEAATATTPAALATESPAPRGFVAGSGTNSGAQCRNHPGVPAAARCAGCQESFCTNCLVDLAGRQYCGSCKVMAVKNAPVLKEATIPCKEAGEALTMAIVGIFCFGIILARPSHFWPVESRIMSVIHG